MSVIHSSVNIHRFDPAKVDGQSVRREWGLEDAFCVGLVGRISKEKGHDLLLAALPAVVAVRPDVMCIFAGEGDQEEALRRHLAGSPLARHVRFVGFRTDIPEIMAAMDIVVVPSRRVESSPGVVKEGMAMGRLVIAADVGGVGEIIRHGVDGWVIPRDDRVALEEALVLFAKDEGARAALAGAARARVAEEFSDERLVERNGALYRQLLTRRP